MFSALSAGLTLVLCSFAGSLFGRLFGFRDFKFKGNGNEYNGCASMRCNSLFISALSLCTKGHKTTT